MTLSKLAKLANVSVSTASKAFSGSSEVNEQTREMIFDVAKKHGCFKKFYNAKYPKLVVAVIAPEFESTYYANYLSLIQKNLQNKNCEVLFSATHFDEQNEKTLIEYYDKHSCADGLIVINSKYNGWEDFDIPAFLIGPIYESNIPSTYSDIDAALCESISYLVKNNVRDIGFIGEALTSSKEEKFLDALQKNGILPEEKYISISNMRFEEGGYEAMQKFFDKNCVPRAIICGYDYMAIGAIKCICDKGLRVPEDIAVMGMDNISLCEYLTPALASIGSDINKICRVAARSVLELINGQEVQNKYLFPCEFYFRKSFEIKTEGFI